MKKMAKTWVEKLLFADKPGNWFVNAQGFYQAGLRLVNTIPKKQKKMFSQQEIFFDAYAYKIAVYLLCHSVVIRKYWQFLNLYNLEEIAHKTVV